ncbi:hypothetical protein ACO22_01170 [Paracoccidioides brasiliensis]|uniref:Tat pathway signal sequence n=1 Tax=Paracoccidioides brasiliensis TaxID=121759 RepID=A0A1D2JME2_PARBR|nr:hypothetical protein ACO22_01170 [Paracoccidioides brasiliensis]
MSNSSNTDVMSVSDEEETLSLLKGAKSELILQQQRFSQRLLFFTLLVVLGISVFCNVVLISEQYKRWNLDKICSVYTSQYSSPLLKDIDISYETVHFNGSFTKKTIYRQRPSPEVDQAWYDLGVHYGSIVIPENEAERYGIRKDQVKRRKDQGGGFFANVEIFHHLHCLNLLRQASHFNFEYYSREGKGAFQDPENILETHISHCVDIIRQQLMCTADIGVFGQWWIEGTGPFIDFNTAHKCRNFEDIRKWAEKRQHEYFNTDKPQKMPGDIVLSEIP